MAQTYERIPGCKAVYFAGETHTTLVINKLRLALAALVQPEAAHAHLAAAVTAAPVMPLVPVVPAATASPAAFAAVEPSTAPSANILSSVQQQQEVSSGFVIAAGADDLQLSKQRLDHRVPAQPSAAGVSSMLDPGLPLVPGLHRASAAIIRPGAAV